MRSLTTAALACVLLLGFQAARSQQGGAPKHDDAAQVASATY